MIVPRFNMATLVSLIEPMRVANYLCSKQIYSWKILSFEGSQVCASNGMSVKAIKPTENLKSHDLIFILGRLISLRGERKRAGVPEIL